MMNQSSSTTSRGGHLLKGGKEEYRMQRQCIISKIFESEQKWRHRPTNALNLNLGIYASDLQLLSILDTQDEFISKVKKQSEAEVQELKDSLEQSQQLGLDLEKTKAEAEVEKIILKEELEKSKRLANHALDKAQKSIEFLQQEKSTLTGQVESLSIEKEGMATKMSEDEEAWTKKQNILVEKINKLQNHGKWLNGLLEDARETNKRLEAEKNNLLAESLKRLEEDKKMLFGSIQEDDGTGTCRFYRQV